MLILIEHMPVPVSVLDPRDTTMNTISQFLALLKVLMGRKLIMNKYKKVNKIIMEWNKYSKEKKGVISSLT